MSHSALLRLEALRKCNTASNWVKCPSAGNATVRSTEENMMASDWQI